MYCPKCGTEVIGESNYCRLCGINLLPVSMLVKGQDLVATAQANGRIATNISGSKLMQCGIATLFIGLVTTIIFGVLNLDTLAGISSALIIGGAGLVVYPWLPGLMNKELSKYAANSVKPHKLNSYESISPDRKFRTSEMYTIPSVTEHTTLKLDDSRLREKVLSEQKSGIGQ